MQPHEERAAGVIFLQRELERNGLRIDSHRQVTNRSTEYFVVTNSEGVNKTDFSLSHDYFLEDLHNSKDLQKHIVGFAALLGMRFRNYSPNDFHCKAGIAISPDINWPFIGIANRDALSTRVDIRRSDNAELIAKTQVVIWHGLFEQFRSEPFRRLQVVVDEIRNSVDAGHLQFFRESDHPEHLAEITVRDVHRYERSSDEDVQSFLAKKVYQMGFRRGDKSTAVWIADPWDANYLGITNHDLLRAAQILEARHFIKLDNELATAGDALILGLQAPPPEQPSRRIGFN